MTRKYSLFILGVLLLSGRSFAAETAVSSDAAVVTTTETTVSQNVDPQKPFLKTFEDEYAVIMGQRPFDVVREAGKQASEVARSLGKALGQQVRNMQIQEKQKVLLERFEQSFSILTRGLALNPDEREHLHFAVEKIYIEDFESGENRLDQFEFRDLPDIIQMEFAEIELARTANGTVNTYNVDGSLKTVWTLRNGKPDGAVVTYYKNKEMQYIDIYKEGRRINRKKYDEEGKLVFEQDYSYELSASPDGPNLAPVPAEQKHE